MSYFLLNTYLVPFANKFNGRGKFFLKSFWNIGHYIWNLRYNLFPPARSAIDFKIKQEGHLICLKWIRIGFFFHMVFRWSESKNFSFTTSKLEYYTAVSENSKRSVRKFVSLEEKKKYSIKMLKKFVICVILQHKMGFSYSFTYSL